MADKQQTIAINHESGPALILAGPGSGKTYVLTHHLLFLINSIGVSPENILVLTFTKEAAKNMKLRFSSLCQINTEEILFGTFHSIFYKFIRLYYGNRYKIVSTTVCREYISTINSKSAYSEEILSLISKYKSKFPIPDINKFEASYEEFPDIYAEYSQILLDRNEIDYDDILLKCLEMLKQNCEFKEKIKKKFKYILIDEFQDISEVQYEIIKLITDKNSNVFAVGDEDQTIYAFRGASKDIMKRYIEDYDAVKIIELNVNYRSTLEITERAGSLISHNRGRLKRSHQSCLTSNTESFIIRYCDSKKEQIKSLLKDIKSATDKGLKCGILVRTNKDIDNLKKVIYANENSKEYEILNSIAMVFYEYLSYDLTRKSQFFYSILNVPDRFLESSMFSDIPPDFDALLKRPFNMRKKNELSLFSTHLSMLNKCTAIAFCIYLWNVVGLKKYFVEIYPNDKEGINDAFNKITVIAKKCNDKEQLLNQLKALGKSNEIKQPVNLQLMTYHGSKGLEFDAVFLPDIVEGHVPGRSGILSAGIEEERRLFYVAVTRAKKKLYVYTREDKENHSVLPSRFINELLNKKPPV